MKKILAILAIVAMFTACGTRSSKTEKSIEKDSANIAIINTMTGDTILRDTVLVDTIVIRK